MWDEGQAEVQWGDAERRRGGAREGRDLDYRGGAPGLKKLGGGRSQGKVGGGTRGRVGPVVAGAGLGPKGRGLQAEAAARAAV